VTGWGLLLCHEELTQLLSSSTQQQGYHPAEREGPEQEPFCDREADQPENNKAHSDKYPAELCVYLHRAERTRMGLGVAVLHVPNCPSDLWLKPACFRCRGSLDSRGLDSGQALAQNQRVHSVRIVMGNGFKHIVMMALIESEGAAIVDRNFQHDGVAIGGTQLGLG